MNEKLHQMLRQKLEQQEATIISLRADLAAAAEREAGLRAQLQAAITACDQEHPEIAELREERDDLVEYLRDNYGEAGLGHFREEQEERRAKAVGRRTDGG